MSAPLYVPYVVVHSGLVCGMPHLFGMVCTRPTGHTGRHLAGGMRRPNGTMPVFEVWP